MEETKFQIGEFVFYYNHIGAEPELGRVKSIAAPIGSEHAYFVVYNCGDDWKNYKNYTGARTPEHLLKSAPMHNINAEYEQI